MQTFYGLSSLTMALYPDIKQYLDTQYQHRTAISENHRAAADALGRWLMQREKTPSQLVVVCTGNSRRSILGATMGNILAAYHQRPLRFQSAGTAPSAFNPRTIETLRTLGMKIEATGKEAARGKADEANPRYLVRWGTTPDESIEEYSKKLSDPLLPQRDFAAIMVCTEADKECPAVPGAALRVAMPFNDPKAFDGTKEEAKQYAATRFLITQVLMHAFDHLKKE